MRYFVLGIVVLLALQKGASAQSAASLVDSASALQFGKKKEYKRAAALYEQAIALPAYSYTTHTPTCYTYLALCYASLRDPDNAFRALDMARAKGMVDLKDLVQDTAFTFMKADRRWKRLLDNVERSKAAYLASLDPSLYDLSGKLALERIGQLRTNTGISDDSVYRSLRNWTVYPTPRKTGITIKLMNRINDTLSIPFYVYIPKSYKASVASKLLVYVPGGWWSRAKLPADSYKNIEFENPTFPYLDRENIVQIFPAVDRRVAMYTVEGYRHIELALAATRSILNIDDNAVFMAGFSDGGSSTFNMAMARPTDFAKFYPINGWINARSLFSNFANRPLYAFSAEHDMYSNRAIDTRVRFAARQGADMMLRTLPGAGHFYYRYEEKVLPLLFSDLQQSRRQFPLSQVKWFSDSRDFAGCDWLRVEPDTSRAAASFALTDTLRSYDMDGAKQVLQPYGQTLSQTRATCINNIFTVNTSRASAISLLISPEMIDLSQPVKVEVNGTVLFNERIAIDRSFMIDSFLERFDRVQVWVNRIDIKIPR